MSATFLHNGLKPTCLNFTLIFSTIKECKYVAHFFLDIASVGKILTWGLIKSNKQMGDVRFKFYLKKNKNKKLNITYFKFFKHTF